MSEEAKVEETGAVELTDMSAAEEPVPEDPEVVTSQPKGKRNTHSKSFHADDAKYPVPLYCSVCCHCQKDMPLCCYALWCPMCLFAEIAEQLGQGACCANFCLVFWAGGCTTICLQTFMNLSGCFCPLAPLMNLVPCIICVNRHVLHHKDFLPKNECCTPCCAHYWCGACALYQEGLHVKSKYEDFKCCAYANCYQECCGHKHDHIPLHYLDSDPYAIRDVSI